ncbi:hypothetical protein GCM10012280_25520 [Wenjunlia tyrosinilytica]|uniref:Uncharacterized protein n=1 Tax=Wenjunlia tyrosinilytica TaxID=1544741 RepID=A0A917ZNT6_9ACTN|nr:hypothetical protein GCM10012280_25520 [Wenjunlia tyrosinilytica]
MAHRKAGESLPGHPPDPGWSGGVRVVRGRVRQRFGPPARADRGERAAAGPRVGGEAENGAGAQVSVRYIRSTSWTVKPSRS